MLNFFVKLLELPLSTEERLVCVFLRGALTESLHALNHSGMPCKFSFRMHCYYTRVPGWGRWHRPPVVATEEEASPTTTSRRPKWTSASAARWLWAAESWAKWTSAAVVGGGGPARRWAGDGGFPRGRTGEVLLVGGLVGDARPARGWYMSCSRR